MAKNAFITIQDRSQVSNLTLQLNELEKEQSKHKASRGKEILKIETDINEIENLKNDRENQCNKMLFHKKINKLRTF